MSSLFIFIKTKIVLPVVIGIMGALGIVTDNFLTVYTPAPEIIPPAVSAPVTPPASAPKASSTPPSTSVVSPKPISTKATTTPAALVDPILKEKREILAKIKKGEILDQEKVNAEAREAVINILCTTKTSGTLRPITGSGVIVSKSGLVLTNAHLAEYLLLKNYREKNFLTCVGRSGSPASPAYTLELVHISKAWLDENIKKILDENPTGTGAHDYAFLAITGTLPGARYTQETLPHLDPEFEEIFITETPVLLAAYPAGFLGGIIIGNNLWMTSSVTSIRKLFYFEQPGGTDLFTLEGNIISQKGASGGAVVSLISGKLLGIIAIMSEGATTGERELSAISLPYVKREFEKQTGVSLLSFLERPVATLVSDFDTSEREALSLPLIEILNH